MVLQEGREDLVEQLPCTQSLMTDVTCYHRLSSIAIDYPSSLPGSVGYPWISNQENVMLCFLCNQMGHFPPNHDAIGRREFIYMKRRLHPLWNDKPFARFHHPYWTHRCSTYTVFCRSIAFWAAKKALVWSIENEESEYATSFLEDHVCNIYSVYSNPFWESFFN